MKPPTFQIVVKLVLCGNTKKTGSKTSNQKAIQKNKVYFGFVGPESPSFIGGKRHAISSIDEFSGYAEEQFMK